MRQRSLYPERRTELETIQFQFLELKLKVSYSQVWWNDIVMPKTKENSQALCNTGNTGEQSHSALPQEEEQARVKLKWVGSIRSVGSPVRMPAVQPAHISITQDECSEMFEFASKRCGSLPGSTPRLLLYNPFKIGLILKLPLAATKTRGHLPKSATKTVQLPQSHKECNGHFTKMTS